MIIINSISHDGGHRLHQVMISHVTTQVSTDHQRRLLLSLLLKAKAECGSHKFDN